MQNAKSRPRTGPARDGIKLYSVTDAAELLGCSGMHVYRLVETGELAAVNIATPGASGVRRSKTRIRSDDLAEYIERHTRRAPATA